MNYGTLESLPSERATAPSRQARPGDLDELSRLKLELLQAEVRVAKARATIAGAEVDVKILTARLRALSK